MKTRRIPKIAKLWLAVILATVLALLLLGHGFADNLDYGIGRNWQVPSGQPDQMWSGVDYDPKLTDPFFESNEWSYPDYAFEGIPLDKRPKDPPRLKHTAKCFSTSSGSKHLVEFCEVWLLDVNMIDLLIHDRSPADDDALRVQIRNGMFTCQYWTVFRRRPIMRPGATWKTKRQELILDKKVYRKGDVIRGKIDFECVQEMTDPNLIKYFGRDPTTIKVYGVFKTIVQ